MDRVIAWKQSGRISLWRYTENERNYPGWNLNADSVGCKSLLELVDALVAESCGSRTINLTEPSQAQLRVPGNTGGAAAWVVPVKLRVTISDARSDWHFPQDLDPARIEFGSDWVAPLREGVASMSAGRGDYSIGNDKNGSLKLWFWW